jgi:hypothetical protein
MGVQFISCPSSRSLLNAKDRLHHFMPAHGTDIGKILSLKSVGVWCLWSYIDTIITPLYSFSPLLIPSRFRLPLNSNRALPILHH